jgi:hypothetical protein
VSFLTIQPDGSIMTDDSTLLGESGMGSIFSKIKDKLKSAVDKSPLGLVKKLVTKKKKSKSSSSGSSSASSYSGDTWKWPGGKAGDTDEWGHVYGSAKTPDQINPMTGQPYPVSGAINPMTGMPYAVGQQPYEGQINPYTGLPYQQQAINPMTGQPYPPGTQINPATGQPYPQFDAYGNPLPGAINPVTGQPYGGNYPGGYNAFPQAYPSQGGGGGGNYQPPPEFIGQPSAPMYDDGQNAYENAPQNPWDKVAIQPQRESPFDTSRSEYAEGDDSPGGSVDQGDGVSGWVTADGGSYQLPPGMRRHHGGGLGSVQTDVAELLGQAATHQAAGDYATANQLRIQAAQLQGKGSGMDWMMLAGAAVAAYLLFGNRR